MPELANALRSWGHDRLRGDNRARASEMMLALAELIELADCQRHHGPLDSHGLTFSVEDGRLVRYRPILQPTK